MKHEAVVKSIKYKNGKLVMIVENTDGKQYLLRSKNNLFSYVSVSVEPSPSATLDGDFVVEIRKKRYEPINYILKEINNKI